MKEPNIYPIFRDKIKSALKSQQLTYAELGRRVGLSESGIKKILTAQDVSLTRLQQICRALDLSIADLAQDDSEPSTPQIEFSRETQEYFSKHRASFVLYFLILTEPKPLHDILREHKISQPVAYKMLRELESRKLIKWLTGDRVVPLGKPALFKYTGTFVKRIVREWSQQMLDEMNESGAASLPKEFVSLRLFYFLPETKRQFREALSELIQEFAMRSVREKKQFGRQTETCRFLGVTREGHFV